MNESNIYREHGFENRKAYLLALCEEYNTTRDVVFMLAQILGPNEDFDGLISTLEDEFGY